MFICVGDDMFFSLYNTNGVSDHHASERYNALYNSTPSNSFFINLCQMQHNYIEEVLGWPRRMYAYGGAGRLEGAQDTLVEAQDTFKGPNQIQYRKNQIVQKHRRTNRGNLENLQTFLQSLIAILINQLKKYVCMFGNNCIFVLIVGVHTCLP